MPSFVKSGTELAINTATAYGQHSSRVAVFAKGGFVAVWYSGDYGQDGSYGAIKGQLLDASGAKVGSEFLVNQLATDTQYMPAVATFADGSFVVAWASADTLQDGSAGAIKARLFAASGAPLGAEFLVNAAAAGDQKAPNVAVLSNGNFLVSWDDAGSGDVFGRLFGPAGTPLGGDIRLNTALAGSQNTNDIVALSGGGFVAVWRTTDGAQDGMGEAVKGQVFDGSGAKVGAEFLVNGNTSGAQFDPSIAALEGGGFVATWVTSWGSEDGSVSAIKGQVFGASGARVGSEFLVNSAALATQNDPVVTSLSGGGFMIVWTTYDTAQDGTGDAVKGQVFDPAGARVGTEFLVNTQAAGNQSMADIATLADGRVVVTWTDSYGDGVGADWGIKAQIFAADTTPPSPVNRAPEIVSDGGGASAVRTVAENGTVAANVAASDPDGQPVTYTIVGGADAARFTIGIFSGTLSFVQAPNFEYATDANGDNIYDVVVQASDGALTDVQTLAIQVANVNEPIVFYSSNNIMSPETHAGPFTVSAADPDTPSTPMTYSITGGADAGLFTLDAATGALSFKAAPDFEAPTDVGRDNVYNVTVAATDGVTSASQAIRFTIYNMNEAPVFAAGTGTAFTIVEGQAPVATFSATDPEGAAVSYRISGGNDAARFTINAQTGALAFVSAPNFEAPADFNKDNVYQVTVTASDGSVSAARALTVTVANVNEPLAFVSGGGGDTAAFTISENQGNVVALQAVDQDGTTPHYGIAGGADAALFELDPVNRTLRFKALPDHETPRDADGNNVYEVTVGATDGQYVDYQAITVTVANVYEGIRFTGPAPDFTVEEIAAGPVGAVSATTEPHLTVTYSISGGADAHLFAIDAATGAISFLAAPDYDAPQDQGGDNLYEVSVTARDGVAGTSRLATVRVSNVDEAAAILSYGGAWHVAATVNENGRSIGRVDAADPDGDAVTYAIAGGADAALFVIDAATGALSFAAAPDFEAPADAGGDNVYEVEVAASTATSSAVQAFAVTVANENEGIAIVSNGGGAEASVAVGENGRHVATVAAADPDGAAVSYAILGGADSHLFVIDAVTGALSFAAAPDREAPKDADGDNVYRVTVGASDGEIVAAQALSVAVADIDEPVAIVSYGGTDAVTLHLGENRTAAARVEAVDEDGGAVAYSIAGGADAALFAIDEATGALRFLAAPDYEVPADADGDNGYDVVVAAGDGAFSVSQALRIVVGDEDEPLAIASAAAVTVVEGQAATMAVHAIDPEGDAITYRIAGGADAARFTIDSATGALAFVSAPDFEAPADADGDNVYHLLVSAGDGTFTDVRALAVTVANVNEAVVFTSAGGSVAVSENGTAVATVAARDPDGGSVAYAIYGGADAARFTIDAATGALAFASAPDFEAPRDADGDNVYDVVVSAGDGSSSDLQTLSVRVGDVDEALAITSAASVTVVENDRAAITVRAADPEGRPVTYAIAGGADPARFTIDSATGALAFISAPDFEAPADADGDNIYRLLVSASDGTFTDIQALAVTVANRNEAVAFTSVGGRVAVSENGTAIATVAARDPDGGSVAYSIAGGADAGRFSIDAATGALAFVAAPDFEAPADADADNLYDVVVSVTDGTFTDTRSLAVQVHNVDEAVAITSVATVTVVENDSRAATVQAVDPDGGAVSYAIAGGADAARFTIDAATGALTFLSAPDFEAPADADGDDVYHLLVAASDGAFTDLRALAVTVANVNEAVAFSSAGGSVAVGENGTAVATVAARDPDGGTVAYGISGGADASRFRIDAASGALSFVSSPDFEAPADADGDNVYDVVVSATDGIFTDHQALSVAIGNVDEPLAITSATAVTVAENGTAAASVAARDPDGAAPTYAIAGGDDAARFVIDAATGTLSFVAAPNFEAPADADRDNVYRLVISATDGTFTATQALAVTVANVNEPVAITSDGGGAGASLGVSENTAAVTAVKARDADGGTVAYAIAGGADAARFTIDAATGALAFVAAPDFEAPADSDRDNVYDVVVSATDGVFTDTQALAVRVGNVNEALAITSSGGGSAASLSVSENNRSVAIVAAADPDGTAPVFAIVGGADAARFTIDAATGVLQFVAAPDHEAPADAGGNNVYNVVVQASDGQYADVQALAVTVQNLRDGATITGTSGSDSINGTAAAALRTTSAEDLVYGRDGHDTILGLGGDDELHGEGGNDMLTGGAGADRLVGGLGKDQFVYNAPGESTAAAMDAIADFNRSQGDKINLSGIDANVNLLSNQAFVFIGTSAFSKVAGQLRFEQVSGNTFVSGDVNGDGLGDFTIRLDGLVPLIGSDFVL